MTHAKAIKRKELAQYGVLGLPLAFSGLPLYIHAPDYYATEFGVSLGLMGIILLAIRLFDAVQDPLIGIFSDKYSHLRHYILLGAMIVLAGSFVALFQPIKDYPAAWMAGCMTFATLSFSVLLINFHATGSLWSKDHKTKTRITSAREAFGLAGLLLATLLPAVLQLTYSKDMVMLIFSIIFSVALFGAGWLHISWYHSHYRGLPYQPTQNVDLKATLRGFAFSKLKLFYAAYGLSLLASSIPAVLILFFVRDYLGAESYVGLFLLLYFLAGICGIPLWKHCAARYGKQNCWMAAMGLSVVSFIWAAALDSGDLVAYGLICLASGLAFGAELILPPSILSDLIDEHELDHNTATLFSFSAFLSKLALALATGVSFFLLEAYDFKPAQPNAADALVALGFAYAVLPCILKLLSIAIVFQTSNKGKISHDDVQKADIYGGPHGA